MEGIVITRQELDQVMMDICYNYREKGMDPIEVARVLGTFENLSCKLFGHRQ